jgi:tryptophan synthase alpha subunit
MLEGRIEKTFARLREDGRTGFIAFVTAGYPTIQGTLDIVPALVEGGADIIELGVPFSDPLAEGPTIQRSSQRALDNGVTPAVCMELLRKLRSRGFEAPVVLMGYYNPVRAYGVEAFCRDAQEAGADGFIVVDLPPEESEDFQRECEKNNLRMIYLLAPTSSPERIARVAELGSGFVYCVSVTGVTGARDKLPAELANFVGRVRTSTDLPIAVGFGISQHKHFQSVGRVADAAIVGSAIIDTIDGGDPSEAAARVKQYAEVVTGRRGRTA